MCIILSYFTSLFFILNLIVYNMKFAYDIGFIIIVCELILIDLMKAFYMQLRYASFILYLFIHSMDMYALFWLFSCLITFWIREPLFYHKTRSLIFVFTNKIKNENFKRNDFGFFKKKKCILSLFLGRDNSHEDFFFLLIVTIFG